MTDPISDAQAEKLLPCPFCGAAITHIESVARSFQPNRIYHEYHHPKNGCLLAAVNPIASFDEKPEPRLLWIKVWNDRVPDADLSELRAEFRQHTAAISKFLGEMLVVYDPCANANEIILVKDACAALLRNALTDRQTIADLSELRAENERLWELLEVGKQHVVNLINDGLPQESCLVSPAMQWCRTVKAALSDEKEQAE